MKILSRIGISWPAFACALLVGLKAPFAWGDWQNVTHSPIPVWPNPPPYQPPVQLTPEQIQQQKAEAERNQRLKTAYIQNQQGIDAEKRGDWLAAIGFFQSALQNSPDDPVIRANLATAENNQGVSLWTKGDMAGAVAFLQNAGRENPNEPLYRTSLATAQQILKQQQDEAERKRLDEIAAANIQQTIQGVTEKMKSTAVPSGGLDFDNQNPGNPSPSGGGGDGLGFNLKTSTTTTTQAPSLDFVDPSVVDARNVSSGLPRAVDAAIAKAFSDAPADVRDRVTKGFESVMTKDWKAAKAWFGDALNHDPDNALLKKWVALCDKPTGGATLSLNKDANPDPKVILPTDEEMQKFFDEALRQPDEVKSTPK